jgi:hypothetical protein
MDADDPLVLTPIACELHIAAVQLRIKASTTFFYFHRHYSGNHLFCQGFVQYFNLLLTFARQELEISRQNIDNATRIERFFVYIRLARSTNR